MWINAVPRDHEDIARSLIFGSTAFTSAQFLLAPVTEVMHSPSYRYQKGVGTPLAEARLPDVAIDQSSHGMPVKLVAHTGHGHATLIEGYRCFYVH